MKKGIIVWEKDGTIRQLKTVELESRRSSLSGFIMNTDYY